MKICRLSKELTIWEEKFGKDLESEEEFGKQVEEFGNFIAKLIDYLPGPWNQTSSKKILRVKKIHRLQKNTRTLR